VTGHVFVVFHSLFNDVFSTACVNIMSNGGRLRMLNFEGCGSDRCMHSS
jgi:hypothetical protein